MKARVQTFEAESEWFPRKYGPSQQQQRRAVAFLQDTGRYDVYFSESGHNREEVLSGVRLSTAMAAVRGWVERGVLVTKGSAK